MSIFGVIAVTVTVAFAVVHTVTKRRDDAGDSVYAVAFIVEDIFVCFFVVPLFSYSKCRVVLFCFVGKNFVLLNRNARCWGRYCEAELFLVLFLRQ